MTRDPGRRDAREVLDEGPHLRRPQRAVDASREGISVLDRGPERFHRLTRQVASAAVDDGHRHEERQVGRRLFYGGDRGLAVERVKDGLDEQEVDAAFLQRARRLRVSVFELVERDVAIGRVVDLGRKRQGDVGWAERAGDETVLIGVRCLTRKPRPFQVHLVGEPLQAVVRLRHARRGKGVGGDDVRARLEIFAMNLGHEVGLRQAKHV